MGLAVVLSMVLSAGGEDPAVGFVVHPHAALYEELAETAANVELANVFLWSVKDTETEEVDFTGADAWIRKLYGSPRRAWPIIDTSVFHSMMDWRQAKTAAAGQNLIDVAGNVRPFSSLFSPMFRDSVLRYTDRLIAWVQENDPEGRIAGYTDGAEWFMPGSVDYNPLAFAAFRDWLQRRYGSLEALNAAWGAAFTGWPQVEPPRGHLLGDDYVGLRTAGFAPIDCAWVAPRFSVTGGERFRLRVEAMQQGVPEGLCAVHLVCYDAGGKPIRYYGDGQFFWLKATEGEPGVIDAVTQVPPDAVAAEFMLRLSGPGRAQFVRPRCTAWPAGDERLPEDLDAWEFRNTGAGDIGATQERTDDGLAIAVAGAPMPVGRSALAWDEWITFCYESMANWLNDCARHMKARDPRRLVASYVGSVFGTHCIADFNMYWQRVDISLANSPDIDINGIQMCIAGDDATYATHLVDIARKYGKPIRATDLIDFPYGLYSGFEPIYRGTLAAVQHGLDEVLWYVWREVAEDFTEYSYSLMLTEEERNRLLRDVRQAITAVDGHTLQAPVALVLPVTGQSVALEGGYSGDVLDRAGWYHLLLDAGLTSDLYTPYEMARRGASCFDGYLAVIVPHCPSMPREAHTALQAYADRGGLVVCSASGPRVDFRGQALKPLAIAPALEWPGVAEVVEAMEPVGPRDRLGRVYWGDVRRWRVDGNTPPPFMRIETSAEDWTLRAALRERFLEGLVSALQARGEALPARLETLRDRVHLAWWKRDGRADESLLFLVHTGPRRAHAQRIRLAGIAAQQAEAWVDFDHRRTLEVGPDGIVQAPDFAHCCIVTLR